MGVFLAGPIVDELGQCAKAGDEVLNILRVELYPWSDLTNTVQDKIVNK